MVSGRKPSRTPTAKELGAAYTADHDGDTSNSVGLYYAAVQILATALERAGTAEPGAVRDQVFNGTFPGTTMGDITYGTYYPDAPGIAHIPFVADQWQPDKKRVVIFPTEFCHRPDDDVRPLGPEVEQSADCPRPEAATRLTGSAQ